MRVLAGSGAARALRIAADVPQAAIAEAMADGTTASAISRWENGKRVPRLDAAVRWYRVLRDAGVLPENARV